MQLRKGKTLPERQPPVAKDKGKEKRIFAQLAHSAGPTCISPFAGQKVMGFLKPYSLLATSSKAVMPNPRHLDLGKAVVKPDADSMAALTDQTTPIALTPRLESGRALYTIHLSRHSYRV